MPRKATTKPRKSKKLEKIILSQVNELATGITSERLSALFFDETKLKYASEPLFRLDSSGHRYYYRYGQDGEPIFYTSVTTMIRNTLPTSPQLIEWLVKQGGEGKDIAQERASYGTFLHIECASLLITGKYNLDDLPKKLEEFMVKERTQIKDGWVDDLKKDILAFAQFVIDKNVKPLAIEIVLYHPEDGYAGAIDLVCELDVEEKGFFGELYASGEKKGQPKETKRTVRKMAIVDLKSGRKGFYESHEIQLQAYKEMWNIHFPDSQVDLIMNFSPRDWRSTPSYNLKDQTDSKSLAKLKHLVELSKIETDKRDDTVTILKGNIDLTKGLASNIEELTFAELIKKNK